MAGDSVVTVQKSKKGENNDGTESTKGWYKK